MFETLKKLLAFLRYDPYVVLKKIGLTTESSAKGNPLVRLITQYKVRKYGLQPLIDSLQSPKQVKEYALFISGHKLHDCMNLYEAIERRKPRTVLEFGAGVSTIFMAHALKNAGIKGKVYSVESDGRWAEVVRTALTDLGLTAHAELHVSTPRLEEYRGQMVASFESLPDVQPDLIYVDGPDPRTVQGSVKGLTMPGLHFMILKDVLLYEWALYVGAKIILDGRLNNYLFLRANLRREYRFKRKMARNIYEISLIR